MNHVESAEAELITGKLRIAQLEREAIVRSGDAALALQIQLDRYKSLVLAIGQVIWTRDPGGVMMGEQPSWAAYTGQSLAQYQHHGWLEAVHPDDRAGKLAVWERAIVARGPCHYEHRLRRHDGEYRYFAVTAVPVFGAGGAIREWVGIHTDITQRRLTEQSLRDGERRFRELADAMPQIVWAARPDGILDYCNRRWYEFTGRSEQADFDLSWADIVHPHDYPEALLRWRAAVDSGQIFEIEFRLRRTDGVFRWHLARAQPVTDRTAAITRWFGTCTDIDERKQTEDQLRASTIGLMRSNRELEEFASVASHDLQEPLRKIRAFVGCLRDAASSLDATSYHYLDRIENAATRMTTLVADLLELSRLSSAGRPFVAVDLNEVVTGVIGDLETRLAETQGRVELLRLPVIAGDPTQMRQLLQNLIGNALKFHTKTQPPVVRISAEILDGVDGQGRASPAASCRISVADNGIGFDEKYLDRVFAVFQRLHGRGAYEGTGIGLAICRKIAERHGGTITARSTPGHGATFLVSLPLHAGGASHGG